MGLVCIHNAVSLASYFICSLISRRCSSIFRTSVAVVLKALLIRHAACFWIEAKP
jgi:hypothetical protein